MICCIVNVLAPERAQAVAEEMGTYAFADGASTAGWHAREVKKNRQLTPGMAGYDTFALKLRPAILGDQTFQMAVRPRILRPLLFNRHEPGMEYGAHVDDPIMGSAERNQEMRVDVSFTLFLSDPQTYAGGELVIGVGGSEHAYKLPAGTLIAYPSDSIHRVAPVTEGVRLAAVGWAQSYVRDNAQRAILCDLDRARRDLFAQTGKTPAFDLISNAHANLVRMWVDL